MADSYIIYRSTKQFIGNIYYVTRDFKSGKIYYSKHEIHNVKSSEENVQRYYSERPFVIFVCDMRFIKVATIDKSFAALYEILSCSLFNNIVKEINNEQNIST